MYLSLSSFITFQLGNSIILITISLLMRSLGHSKLVNHNLLYIFCVLFILRLVIPCEFLHSITLPSKFLLPAINRVIAFKIILLQNGIVITVASILVFIWILVSCVKLSKFVKSYYRLKYITRLCSGSDKIFFHNKSFRILFVNECVPPSVIGVFSPIIILPKSGFSERERKMILSHEITHISNFDLYIKYIYSIISIVYWWNPLIYLFKDRMIQILEIRTDANLMQNFDDIQRIEYVETLIKASKIQSKNYCESLSQNFNFATKSNSNLLQRSKYILSGSKKQASLKLLLTIILSMFFLSSSIIFEPYAVDVETETTSQIISEKNSYFIKNGNNYDMYVNDDFFISYEADKIPKEFENIKKMIKKD